VYLFKNMKTSRCYYTAQESKVCELLRKDYDIKEIAEIMKINPHTVKSHISKIKRMNFN
ncbi:TPA: hypothetical protein IAD41_01665, partial [Candidatus Scatenecus faecavium]|nr:hypothetical protein [Candidatus Scatenecus faecavium]